MVYHIIHHSLCLCPIFAALELQLPYVSADRDFVSTPVEVVFDPTTTQGRECSNISLLDDLILEASETFDVLLVTIDPDVTISDAANTLVIVITDNDGKPLHSERIH